MKTQLIVKMHTTFWKGDGGWYEDLSVTAGDGPYVDMGISLSGADNVQYLKDDLIALGKMLEAMPDDN